MPLLSVDTRVHSGTLNPISLRIYDVREVTFTGFIFLSDKATIQILTLLYLLYATAAVVVIIVA